MLYKSKSCLTKAKLIAIYYFFNMDYSEEEKLVDKNGKDAIHASVKIN